MYSKTVLGINRIHAITPFVTARNSSCGKVMFSQVCVIPSVHMGGLHPGGSAWGFASRASAWGGVCIQGGLHLQRGWADPQLDTMR